MTVLPETRFGWYGFVHRCQSDSKLRQLFPEAELKELCRELAEARRGYFLDDADFEATPQKIVACLIQALYACSPEQRIEYSYAIQKHLEKPLFSQLVGGSSTHAGWVMCAIEWGDRDWLEWLQPYATFDIAMQDCQGLNPLQSGTFSGRESVLHWITEQLLEKHGKQVAHQYLARMLNAPAEALCGYSVIEYSLLSMKQDGWCEPLVRLFTVLDSVEYPFNFFALLRNMPEPASLSFLKALKHQWGTKRLQRAMLRHQSNKELLCYAVEYMAHDGLTTWLLRFAVEQADAWSWACLYTGETVWVLAIRSARLGLLRHTLLPLASEYPFLLELAQTKDKLVGQDFLWHFMKYAQHAPAHSMADCVEVLRVLARLLNAAGIHWANIRPALDMALDVVLDVALDVEKQSGVKKQPAFSCRSPYHMNGFVPILSTLLQVPRNGTRLSPSEIKLLQELLPVSEQPLSRPIGLRRANTVGQPGIGQPRSDKSPLKRSIGKP